MEHAKIIQQIYNFILGYVEEDENVVIPVSGGLDSDVVARLCTGALGADRIKLFFVYQSDQENTFYTNASHLAKELGVNLLGFHLEDMNQKMLEVLSQGDFTGTFQKTSFLDAAKLKCSIRTSILSAFQDKGNLIAGCTNRSEKELGLLVTFGDNIANFKPIAHLYKTQVIELAKYLGTSKEVLLSEPSAGFWRGETDYEDLAYWMVNGGPILSQRSFSPHEEETVKNWMSILNYTKIDDCLKKFKKSNPMAEIADSSGLPIEAVNALYVLTEKSKKYKIRPILVEPKLN